MLYGELATGMRKRGRPCLRFKDVCKKDMTLAQIDHKMGETIAEERTSWQVKVREGIQVAEASLTARSEEKRATRKGKGVEEQEESSSSHEDGRSP